MRISFKSKSLNLFATSSPYKQDKVKCKFFPLLDSASRHEDIQVSRNTASLFLASAIDESESAASRPDRFTAVL
jgi:hypothetical protein